MTEQSFSEADKQKLVEFLNIVAKNATFTMKTDEIINYFKLLAYMQQSILPKIDAHILEVLKVSEIEKKATEKTEPPPKAAKTKA
jgi:hypothetical protein